MKIQLTRTLSLLIVGLALIFSLPSCKGNGEKNDKRPNVILIITDDQGYGDVECLGHPVLKTPGMNLLYEESYRMDNFHVDPSCAPTRAALLSGKYSARTGVWATTKGRNIMHKDEKVIAEYFQESGYATAMFGKWHMGDNWPYRPVDRGFDESLCHGGGVIGETPDAWGNSNHGGSYFRNGQLEKHEDIYSTDLWFKETLKFAEQSKNQNKPFFIYLPTNAPHGPCEVEEKYAAPYMEQGIAQGRAMYYGMIANIDENLINLRKRLSEVGLAENTLLIFMGDNGSSSNHYAGMRGGKAMAWEGGHRTFCFMYWTEGGFTGGKDIDVLSHQFDLIPTLAEICDLGPVNDDLDGVSLAGVLTGKQETIEDRITVVHNQQGQYNMLKYKDFQVMTPDGWRLTSSMRDDPHIENMLTNINDDPGQQTNLADQYPDMVEKLAAEYEKWWKHIGDRADAVVPFYIGGDENPVKLSTHALHDTKEWMYSQMHLRLGVADNGYWPVYVNTPGTYKISLCRWPREAETAIRDGIAAIPDPPFASPDRFAKRKAGPDLDIISAKLNIAGFEGTKPVNAGDREIDFTVELEEGETKLVTTFTETNGTERCAYFVYLELL